jgi:hypothetical protein
LNKQISKQGLDKLNNRETKITGNKHLSILTLNVNGLNAPKKRCRIANWIKKQDQTICCLQEAHLAENKILA